MRSMEMLASMVVEGFASKPPPQQKDLQIFEIFEETIASYHIFTSLLKFVSSSSSGHHTIWSV